MIPETKIEFNKIKLKSYPSLTYKLDLEAGIVLGHTDGKDAIKQAIVKILNTQRYEYIIYSWNYGISIWELFGKDPYFVCSELEGRIKDALIRDDRIKDVTDFKFNIKDNAVEVTFTAKTILGDINDDFYVIRI